MTGSHVVVPNPRIATSLGVVNIVLGGLLLLASLGMIAWTIAFPRVVEALTPPAARQEQERPTAEVKARRAAIDTQLAGEREPVVRAPLLDEIDTLESDQLDREMSELGRQGRTRADVRETLPFWVNHGLGILLNALLIASGVGLVALRGWGRRLALYVAGLKVAKLVALTLVGVFLAVPLQVVQTRQTWARMEARNRRAAPAVAGMGIQMAQIAAVSATVTVVALGAAGLVYPALSLWLLNKRSVRAACRMSARAAVASPTQ
jgi:hypothetical protein